MLRGSRREKIDEWTGRLDRYKASGQTIEQFCKAEGISACSFYQWKKKLTDGTIRPVSGFQSVRITPSAASQETIVRLNSGMEISLGNAPSVVETVMRQLLAWDKTNSPGAESC